MRSASQLLGPVMDVFGLEKKMEPRGWWWLYRGASSRLRLRLRRRWDLAAQGVCRRCRGRIRTRAWFWAWTRGLAWKTVGGAPENRVQEVARTPKINGPGCLSGRPVAGKCGAARPVLSCQLSAVSVLATCSGCGSRLFCSRVCRVQVGELSEAPRPGRAPRFRRSRRGVR